MRSAASGRLWLLLMWASVGGHKQEAIRSTCESLIYCQGNLLKTIQLADIFQDSKTFVDKKMKYSQNETLDHFEKLMNAAGNNPTHSELLKFVNEHFEDGNELQWVHPADWVESPQFLDNITDPSFREWAKDLNAIWKNLTRRVSDTVKSESGRYSLIYVPNNFVVPGGRFREIYYWDTYWVVRGLLVSNMTETVKGILENFLYLIRTFGHIPNGGRVYYIRRSQPPLLIPMVDNYYNATMDLNFIRYSIASLEDEFQFWMKYRTVKLNRNGTIYTLARYYAVSQGPRPESFKEDYKEAHKHFDDETRRQEFYVDIRSGAESGWDFSSRWFIKNGTNSGNLTNIQTRHIIPVDLNSFLYLNAHTLSKFYKILGNITKCEEYARLAQHWKDAVTAVLWNEDQGSWFDYDTINNIQRKYFYPSNFAPLWTKCYDESKAASIAKKVVHYVKRNNVKFYLGGIPTSTEQTGQQWDMPNAWPPLQMIIIQGLERTQQPDAIKLAYKLAKLWVRSNFKGYQDSHRMYEKYDAGAPGKRGHGGEYEVQDGFGWTNGIILELLAAHGKHMKAKGPRVSPGKLQDSVIPTSVF